ARVLELATVLSEFTMKLHQLVGATWRLVAPTSDVKYRPGSVQNAMGRFVSEDPGMTRAQVSQEVDRLRELVAALIAGVGEVGRKFAGTYNARFAPSEIKVAANAERGPMFVKDEVKYWRKYVELWDTLDEATIEKEIRDAIATVALGFLPKR